MKMFRGLESEAWSSERLSSFDVGASRPAILASALLDRGEFIVSGRGLVGHLSEPASSCSADCLRRIVSAARLSSVTEPALQQCARLLSSLTELDFALWNIVNMDIPLWSKMRVSVLEKKMHVSVQNASFTASASPASIDTATAFLADVVSRWRKKWEETLVSMDAGDGGDGENGQMAEKMNDLQI